MFHSDLMTLWYCLGPEKASIRFFGSSVAALQGLGSRVFASTAAAACAAIFLQILLFSSNLSSFPLLQHWLLPVRNCSSIPCAELHLLSSLL